MKLTNKVALISGLGCLALVGTGFAAWVYNDGVVADKSGEVNAVAADVESYSAIITPSVAGAIKLDEDDTATVSGTHKGKIVWTTDFAASATIAADSTKTDGNGTTPENEFNTADYTLTYTITVDAGLSDYVTIKSGKESGTWVSGKALPTVAADFSFNNDNAPQTPTAYQAMKTAIASKKITITFKAVYSAK
jgi:hypothetical protein